jgi:D-glycero-D-manno-heptose 1,7-bisphosphate phosphatase
MANGAQVPVLVVTNQSGIDRGLFGWDAFAAVEDRIAALLAAEDATLDAIAACPFHPDFTPGYGPAQARYRKPEAGLITELSEALGIALSDSWMVGDQPRDMEAARTAGLAGGIMVGDPAAAATRVAGSLSTSSFAVHRARTLREAVQFLRTTRLFAHA